MYSRLLLVTLSVFVIVNYSFCVSVIAVRQISQGNGKPVKTCVLYLLGFASELVSQFSLWLSSWINPANTARVVYPRPVTLAHVASWSRR